MHALRLVSFRALTILSLVPAIGCLSRPVDARAQAAECCVVPDVNGTAVMPPQAGCLYLGTTEIVDGMPSGSTIQINASFGNFSGVTEVPGGILGGTVSNYDAVLLLNMTGTGAYASYSRFIALPLPNPPFTNSQQISWGPRVPFAPVQTFPAMLERLQGQIIGDPDFDLLRITGGASFGLPSPGQGQIVASFGNRAVSGYFDLMHRIDFIGSPAGPFAGLSGSTTRQRRFSLCPEGAVPVEPRTWSGIKALMEH